MMELLLLYEVMEWEKLFWNKLKDLLDNISNDRLGGVKERLTREWRADCWKRLNPQMHAAEKRFPDINDYSVAIRNFVGKRWASYMYISQFFEGVENPNLNSISLWKEIQFRIDRHERRYPQYEICPRLEYEMENIKFRLKCGLPCCKQGLLQV